MRRLVFGLLVLAACGTAAGQQVPPGLPTPRLQNVFPAGAKAAAAPQVKLFSFTFTLDTELTVNGTDLDEPEKLLFSHPGIKGEYVRLPAPAKKDSPPPKANTNVPHKFRVSVAPDVPPGTYDVRFVGKFGVSNPRAFVVGNFDELNEKEPNNDVPEAQRVKVGTTVNGVLANPTDVDYTVFAAKAGQRVVVSCLSSSIDGRANPMIEVFDSAGRKLAANRNYRDGDSLTDVTAPADGDYYVRVSQFAYQGGGPDYVYRLTVSAGPWIDAVFPPAIEPGKSAQVTVYGRNLPNGQPSGFTIDGAPLEKLVVTINPPTAPDAATRITFRGRIDPPGGLQDGFEYSLKGPSGTSNAVPVYFARHKLVLKKNAGGTTPATAEAIPAPCEVAGFLSSRGGPDWYSFEAKKGDVFLVEVNAEGTGTQADFYFSVRDGKDPKRDLSGEQDDDNDTLHPFGYYTRTADPPPYRFTAPEDGKYLVLVGCREAGVVNGPRSAYRLRVSPARPDFRAVALPYSRHFQTGANVWQGGSFAYDVYVQRIDGYTGTVTVTAENLPTGVAAKPLSIGPGARWGVLVLNATAGAAPTVAEFKLRAKGVTADGKALARDVRPASVTWGVPQQNANVPVLGRLDQSFVIAVRAEKALFTLAADAEKATVKVNNKDEKLPALVVKQGDKFSVPIRVNWTADKQNVTLTGEPINTNNQNSPVTVQIPAQPTKDKPEAVLNFDVKSNAAPGTYCVTMKGVAQVPYARPGGGGAMAKGGNVPAEAFADPIEVVVIPNSVAKLTVGNLPNNTLKLGGTAELTVKVERQHDFAGEFTVRFELPKGVTGVTAEEVTIPAGKDEAKLVLAADDDAKPGAVSNATVTITAKYAGKHTVTHEAKVNFTVAK